MGKITVVELSIIRRILIKKFLDWDKNGLFEDF